MFDGSTEFSPLNSSLLVVVPCGQSKIWKFNPEHGPAKAMDAYTGASFRVNKAFAMIFSDRWVILSAKYGFIDPDFIMPEDYNVTFKKLSTKPISFDELEKQVKEKTLNTCNIVVALGGEDYLDIVNRLFSGHCKVISPTKGLALGMGMQRIKSLLNQSREQMLKRITSQDEP